MLGVVLSGCSAATPLCDRAGTTVRNRDSDTGGWHTTTEAIRRFDSMLREYADPDRAVQVIAVTSAVPGEGRSATACGLALLFSESGRRVLVVDAELRRPRLAAFLGREDSSGLSTVLAGRAPVDQVLQPWGAGLWLLAAGHAPPNPSELLSTPRMAELVEELRGRFDIVIIDCPPLLAVTDAAVIAARSDGALLVVRSQKTKTAQVTAAARALRSVDAHIVGCVLNMVPAKSNDIFPHFERYAGGPSAPDAAGAGDGAGDGDVPAAPARWWRRSCVPPASPVRLAGALPSAA